MIAKRTASSLECRTSRFTATYDLPRQVIYITIGAPQKATGSLSEDEWIIRKNDSGKVVGITIWTLDDVIKRMYTDKQWLLETLSKHVDREIANDISDALFLLIPKGDPR